MKQIISILRRSKQGVSQPFLCQDETGTNWWCKGQLSGTQSQRYEWICAHLARLLALPVPDFDIMEVPVALSDLWQRAHPEFNGQFVLPSNPYVFASRCVPACRDLSATSPFLDRGDRNLQARIFVFDRFIRNTDRTDGNSNVLVDIVDESAIHVIDHNGAFDPAFDETAFRTGHVFREAFRELPAEERSQLVGDAFQSLATFDLDSVWNEMPGPWIDEITTGLTADGIRGILSDRWSSQP